jgi:hypothetical protein
MNLIHTSPVEIKSITKNGVFGDCLFFSTTEYAMGEVKAVYNLEVSEDKIIEVCDLESSDIITDICNALDVDEEQAEELLTGESTAYDFDLDGEDDWFIQAKQGECAKLMGFDACEAEDEQGVVYIVPMTGKLNELKKA